MTTFNGLPLKLGVNTGNGLTRTDGHVTMWKEFGVSANSITTAAIPAGSTSLMNAIVIVETSASGQSTGMTIRLGDTAGQAKFGTVNVSAEDYYTMNLAAAAVSAGTQLIADSTAQGSAGNIGTFIGRVFVEVLCKGIE